MLPKDLAYVCRSKNGLAVGYDPKKSHAATHFRQNPELKLLIAELLADTDLIDEEIEFDKDMGRVIGKSQLVKNEPADEIIYAKRKNREVFFPFNKTRPAVNSRYLSVWLKKHDKNSYKLLSAWVGRNNLPPVPGYPNELAASKPFWLKHSLVYSPGDIQTGSETTECPWG
jgi:hypothetical protein